MGRHNEEQMAGHEAVAAFERFVRAERALLAHLTDTVTEHEAMLDPMR